MSLHTEIIPANSAAAAVALASRLVETGVQFSVAPHPNNRDNCTGVQGWQFAWVEAPGSAATEAA